MSGTQARMNLIYRRMHDALIDGVPGSYVGRGNGKIRGAISGNVTWDLYETQEKSVCSANLIGTISDGDEDRLEFRILGIYKRDSVSDAWRLRSTVHFKNGTGKLTRFDDAAGTGHGVFDMTAFTHEHLIQLSAVPED